MKESFCSQLIQQPEERMQTQSNKNLYLEAILETTPDGFWVVDANKNILQANSAYCRMSGYTRQELQKMQVNEIDADEQPEETKARIERVSKYGAETFQTRHKRKDGSFFDVEISISFLDIDGGCMVCFCRDITEKKKVDHRLRESEKSLIRSQQISHVGSWTLNLSTNEVVWSEELYKMYGFDPFLPPPPYTEHMKLFTAESWDKLSSALQETSKLGVPYELELEMVAIGGKKGWMWVRGEAVWSDSGEIVGLWGAAQDITKRKQMEKAIYNEKELLKATLLSVGDGVISADNFGQVRIINKVAEEMTGWRQVDGFGRSMEEVLNIATDIHGEKYLIARDGASMPVESITSLIKDEEGLVNGVVAVVRDITARLGGDEFVIILPKTDGEEAEQIIKRIKALLSLERVGALVISVSFGYETKKLASEKIEGIFKSAEDRMYNHKIFESPSMRGRTIDTIINTLYEKNKREEQHSRRVGVICEKLALTLELSEFKVGQLRTAGLLHDIGKIAIEESILSKPGALLQEEFEEIRRHAEIGFRILNTVPEMAEIADYVLAHHERWDGTGYPKGLKGEAIPFESRIMAIADSYDAMTTKRSYCDAMPAEDALLELKQNAGGQFDPKLVEIFLKQGLYKL